MLATLSTTTADAAGYVELDATWESTGGDVSRRVNRIATLDGGVVISDGGFSEGDRTIELEWAPVEAAEATVARLLRTYSRLHVSTRAGVFLAAPESYKPGAGASTLRLLVISKQSA